MNDELEKIWKEDVVVQSGHPGICLNRLRKTVEHLSQDKRCFARDSKRELLKYKSNRYREPNLSPC
jgi:hypothetical protein